MQFRLDLSENLFPAREERVLAPAGGIYVVVGGFFFAVSRCLSRCEMNGAEIPASAAMIAATNPTMATMIAVSINTSLRLTRHRRVGNSQPPGPQQQRRGRESTRGTPPGCRATIGSRAGAPLRGSRDLPAPH